MTEGAPTEDDADAGASPDLRWRTSLRLTDGWVGFDDDALYLRRGDELARVAFENVVDVAYEDYDYFLLVLSLVLVGFGLWFVSDDPASLLFSLAGLGSLWRLYRRRGAVTVRVRNRARQLTFYPVDGTAFYDALGEAMDAEVVSDRLTFRGR